MQKGRTARHGLLGRLETPDAESPSLKTSQHKWPTREAGKNAKSERQYPKQPGGRAGKARRPHTNIPKDSYHLFIFSLVLFLFSKF